MATVESTIKAEEKKKKSEETSSTPSSSSSSTSSPGSTKETVRQTSEMEQPYNRPSLTDSQALVQLIGIGKASQDRQREKNDLTNLNDRLTKYITQVHSLKRRNIDLQDELKKLKAKWSEETSSVKVMFQDELDEARRLLDEANHEKGRLEVRVKSLKESLCDLRKNLDDARKAAQAERKRADGQLQHINDINSKNTLLRRQVQSHEGDRDKDRKFIDDLKANLKAAREDLDKETLLRIDAENRRKTLEDELEFLKTLHDQEIKELEALAYRDTTSEICEHWEKEMEQALKEMQKSYDDKVDGMRAELESSYNLKVRLVQAGAPQNNKQVTYAVEESKILRGQMGTLRDKLADLDSKNAQLLRELELLRREKENARHLTVENENLKSEVVQLRAELQAIIKQLNHISDTKLGLESEIGNYRKLLDRGEKERADFRQIIEFVSADKEFTFRQTDATSGNGTKVSQVTKTTPLRTKKGPIEISEIADNGKFVQLENAGRKDEELGGWHLKCNIDGEEKVDVTLPKGFTLKPSEKVKLWAKGQKPTDAGASDIEIDQPSWGVGSNDVITKLINPANEERATHRVQPTTVAKAQ